MFHTCINLFPPRPIQAVQGYQFSTCFCSWYLLIHFIWKLKEVVFQHKFCISLDTLCVFLLSNASLIACRSAWCSMVGLRLTTSAATKIAFFFYIHIYIQEDFVFESVFWNTKLWLSCEIESLVMTHSIVITKIKNCTLACFNCFKT